MEKKGEEAAAKFINALIKSMQTLCHGYLEFQTGIEIIGHINLSVDKGSSLDYILKEKVCRNDENSTLFISDSFHAEAKAEEVALRKIQSAEQNASFAHRGGGRLASAISSISSSLSGPRERNRRSADGRDFHKGPYKRRSSQELPGDVHPAKVSHTDSSRRASSPARSRSSIQTITVTDGGNTTETLLPQTASVGDGSGIGVNLASSVLEPMGNQNDSDLTQREDDSDGDLEVTFIKEEYGSHGDGSVADFDGSAGNQFAQRGFMPGSFDHGQEFHSDDAGPSTSNPGPSGMRGVSGIQSFVNSLSAFGSLGAPGLPLTQICPSSGGPKHKGGKAGGLNQGSPRSAANTYAKSQSSLQRAFALHREDKRKKQEGAITSEEDLKQRLELMSELLSLKGISSTEDYKTALIREKRRLAKKLYRASLPEEKRIEIKEKDKLHKRLKRATRLAAAESMTEAVQHFSDCSSDITSQKDFDTIPPRNSSSFSSSFAVVGSVSMGGMQDKDTGPSTPRQGGDSPRMVPRPSSSLGSKENIHGMGSESMACDAGMGSMPPISVGRLGSSFNSMPRICSSTVSSHVQVGTDPMESFASMRHSGVGPAGMVFGSVGSVPWIDPVSFDPGSQEHRHLDHDGGQREGYNLMKLGQR